MGLFTFITQVPLVQSSSPIDPMRNFSTVHQLRSPSNDPDMCDCLTFLILSQQWQLSLLCNCPTANGRFMCVTGSLVVCWCPSLRRLDVKSTAPRIRGRREYTRLLIKIFQFINCYLFFLPTCTFLLAVFFLGLRSLGCIFSSILHFL